MATNSEVEGSNLARPCSFYLNDKFKNRIWKWADGKPKEHKEMEKRTFKQRPKEPQTSTSNNWFQIMGDAGHNSWLDVYMIISQFLSD